MTNLTIRNSAFGRKAALLGSTAILALALTVSGATAQFAKPDTSYEGSISAAASERTQPIVAGSEIVLTGSKFKPGQEVTLTRGDLVINADGPFVADAEGKFEAKFTLPADAEAGVHPVLVSVANPSSAAVFDLKISPVVPLSGEDKFTLTSQKLVTGLYQAAYSHENDALFVTAAVGRPPVKESALLKVNPETLAIEAQITPGAAPARPDGTEGGVFAVYGVDVDDANGNVWVTNTRQNTIAVYKQSDLSLVKQFDVGTVNHARDVLVDAKGGKAYATATRSTDIQVFDLKTLELVDTVTFETAVAGEEFSVGSIQLDPTTNKIYTVSITTNEGGILDLATGKVEKIFPLVGANGSIGVGFDPESNRIFVASQTSDNLLIVDAATGETLHDVATGSGALNVEFDPASKLAYVANRGSGTVTVVNVDGEIVANLDNGTYPNHVVADGKGHVYAINKSAGPDDAKGDRITKIVPAS